MNGDLISRSALRKKLQSHHDFFVNAWGGFSNLPPKDKARVDEITHCIAETMNAPAVEAGPKWISVKDRLPEDVLADKDTKVIHCLVALEPPRKQPKRKPLVTKAQRQWNSWTKHWEWGRISGVIYWMPLPEPPKEG